MTIEDPVEFVHHNQSSIVVQQEVYTDVPSFRQALTHVLRQDPDVVVIGEMRDLETVATALTAAETGHLVLATLHTPDAVQTIQRIFSVFPHEQQNNIMYQLANTLQAVLAQRLLPRADGKGLVLACEVCIATPAVRKRIREGEPHLLFSEMQMGRKHQMQTLDGVAAGALPARRDQLRRRHLERPRARDDPPAIHRCRAAPAPDRIATVKDPTGLPSIEPQRLLGVSVCFKRASGRDSRRRGREGPRGVSRGPGDPRREGSGRRA